VEVPFSVSAWNSTLKQIKVVSVSPSCGCTSAKMVPNDISSQERGVLKGKIDVGARRGVSEFQVAVTADNGSVEVIKIRVVQAEFLGVENPGFFFWKRFDDAKEICLLVTVRSTQSFHILTGHRIAH